MSTKQIYLVVTFILVFNSFTKAQSGVTIYDSIISGGLQRKFRLYVPNSYNSTTASPLILNLHGYTSNSQQQMSYSNFMPIADTAKFLIVHPDGTFSSGQQYWNAGFGGAVNDVQFLSQLIDSIKANYNIDLNSVYSCGMSNGGIMSYYLACNLSNRIAAIASVTGDMLNVWSSCTPPSGRPFPVMEIHGTNDGTVFYNGDGTFAPIDSVVKKWRKYNNCIPTAGITNVPDVNTTDGCTAVNYKYSGGTNGATVELYKINGGSHSWPGAFPVIGNTNEDFNASAEIWRFFRKYKLNQLMANVGFSEKEKDSETLKLYPNPASQIINFSPLKENKTFHAEFYDVTGKLIKKEVTQGAIVISDLKDGVYFITLINEATTQHFKF
ncbi:MAG: hypothetical protein JWO32_3166, partial [Bacteroidetes bacterium]|nr:hypothetical protein [Bacteroidota bacterium]